MRWPSSGLASPLYRRIGERYLLGDSVARFSLANLEKDMLLVRAGAGAGRAPRRGQRRDPAARLHG
ncbi:hypothetical protein LP420_39400 [Massilia sp. B-10]|nr:hypothetical protein LP420_39400 [Massilia sp. B-10]